MSPAAPQVLVFSPFRVDVAAERLLRGDRVVPVRPKTFAVLLHLVGRPGVLVTRDELLATVWTGAAVSDDTLTQSITELRRALRDDARRPRFIETAHGRGFRFVAPVGVAAAEPAEATGPAFVGRTAELTRIGEALERVRSGRRQIVLVGAEAGAGKSELVARFLRSVPSELFVARGQCVQQYGEREPYLPIVDALESMLRGPRATLVKAAIRSHAPTWAARLPSAAGADAGAEVTQARSLREINAAFEELASKSPVAVVLEDLHWADPSTLDLLTYAATRSEPAAMLLVGTYRSNAADAGIAELVARLATRRDFSHLTLAPLTQAELETYVTHELGEPCPPRFAQWLRQRTGGNALFAVGITGHLRQGGRLWGEDADWSREIPKDLQAVIENQVRPLSKELRRTLDAASVAGLQFHTQEIAACLEAGDEQAEEWCAQLDHDHGLLTAIEPSDWPDGSAGTYYAFRHDLYRQWVRERLPRATQRVSHERIGRRLETGFGQQASVAVLAQIASHYEHGGDCARATSHLASAALRALGTGAFREAAAYVEDGLRQLDRLGDSSQRDAYELGLRRILAVARLHTHHYSGEGLDPILSRTSELAARLGDDVALFDAHYARWFYLYTAGQSTAAAAVLQTTDALAERLSEREAVKTRFAAGLTAWLDGDITQTEELMTSVAARGDHGVVAGPGTLSDYGIEPAVGALLHLAHAAAIRGRRSQVMPLRRRALALAQGLERPFSLTAALAHTSSVCHLCGDHDEAANLAERAVETARKYGFPLWENVGLLVYGSEVARDDFETGLAMMRQGIVAARGVRSVINRVFFAIPMTACLEARRVDAGLEFHARAVEMASPTWNNLFDAELMRMHAELLFLQGRGVDTEAAEAELRSAHALAAGRGAWLFALRAALALAEVERARKRIEEAAKLLREGLAPIDAKERLVEVDRAVAMLAALRS
ncbi:MAG TPA: AAA family ATPase [Candidatus Binatia bacterium]|nr:AAA family ATPase [Candidatus Binatia bacterium]